MEKKRTYSLPCGENEALVDFLLSYQIGFQHQQVDSYRHTWPRCENTNYFYFSVSGYFGNIIQRSLETLLFPFPLWCMIISFAVWIRNVFLTFFFFHFVLWLCQSPRQHGLKSRKFQDWKVLGFVFFFVSCFQIMSKLWQICLVWLNHVLWYIISLGALNVYSMLLLFIARKKD